MIRNDDYFEIIKEQNKELAKFRPFKSAYEMKKEIERLNNIINKLKKYIEDTKKDGYKLVWINEYKNYFEAGIEEILRGDKE